MKKIAIFASGNGSNFQAIVDEIEKGNLMAEIAVLVTDKPDCFAAERARKHNIPVFAFSPKNYLSKEEYEKEIARFLINKNVSLIVLAGYMRLIGEVLLTAFPNRIINIHPALLPAFPGKNGIQQAYNYGVKIFGVTVHYVDSGMDTGKIIAQECFKTDEKESLSEIEQKIHALEHQLYPNVIKKILCFAIALLFGITQLLAQNSNNQNFYIEGGARYGTALYHPKHAIYLKDFYYGGLEFRFGKQTIGNNQWERMLNFPAYGVTLRYTSYYDFLDPKTVRKERNKVLGQNIALFGYFQISMIRYKWFNWNCQIGMGAAYFTKIHRKNVVYKPDILTPDPNDPSRYINEKGESVAYPNNCLISVYVTPYINLQTGFDFKINNQFDLCFNANFNHASNASMNMPNYGINELQGMVSLRYHFSPIHELVKIDSFPKHKQINSLFFTLDPGWLIARYDDNYYFKTGVSVGYMRNILPVLNVGASFEACYVRYLAHSKDYEKEEWEKPDSPRISMPKNIYTGAIYGFSELVFGRYALHVGFGFYLFKGPGQAKKKDLAQNWDGGGTLKNYPIVYEKVGFRIYVGKNRNHFIGASLRGHAPVADYLAFDYGFKFLNI